GVRPQRSEDRLGGDHAVRSRGHPRHLEGAVLLQPCRRLADRRMLERGDHQMATFARPASGAEQHRVVRLRARRREHHLRRAGAQERRDLLPRLFHRVAGRLAEAVDGRRIAVLLTQPRQHRLPGGRMERRRRVVVEVHGSHGRGILTGGPAATARVLNEPGGSPAFVSSSGRVLERCFVMRAARIPLLLILLLIPCSVRAGDPPPASPVNPEPATPASSEPAAKPAPKAKASADAAAANKGKTEKSGKMSRREMKAAIAKLPQQYQDWLAEVDVLITDEEKTTFLRLDKDYQRDAFIKRFWEVRDPIPGTPRNEFYDRWTSRVEEAKERFKLLTDDRARILLLNGEPVATFVSTCSTLLWPLEAWFYAGSDRVGEEFLVVFYRKWGAGLYRVWNPLEGLDVLFVETGGGSGNGNYHSTGEIANGCINGDRLAGAINWVASRSMDYSLLQAKMESRPAGPRGEWVSSFGSYSTDVSPDAVPLKASLGIDFPGRHQNRTAVQGVITVAAGDATVAKLGEHVSYDFLINGEVLQERKLFDSFRYKFDFPGNEAADSKLPIVFQRYLRPGDYTLIVKLEDINSGKVFREERKLTVPAVDKALPPPPSTDMEAAAARLLEEANAATANGETTVKLVQPVGELQSGMLRFDTMTTGSGIASVTFALDGKPILTKKKPPYSVELDLGRLPRTRKLSVAAFDQGGTQLAADELLVNAAAHRFKVRLAEPRRGQKYVNSLLARVDVDVPDGDSVERVELYLNETKVATLFQPPYTQPIVLPRNQPLAYVRAVAYLPDGNSTEDLVFVNAPDYLENLDVQF